MDYRRDELMPGVYLSVLSTDRFRLRTVGVALLSQMEGATAYMDALLPHVLLRGTVSCPDQEAVARRLEELGGASVRPLALRVGEVRASGFRASLPEGCRAGGAAELLGELLCAPNTRGGLLLPDYVNSEGEALAGRIREAKKDGARLALCRLIERMCAFEPLGESVPADPDAAGAIRYRRLTRRWQELLSACPIEICCCGPASYGELRDAFLAALAGLPRGELCFDIGTDVRMNSVEAAPRVFREGAEEGPGRLAMGWRLGECMEEPDPAALRVFNAAYGGAPSGRLSGLPGGFSSCLDEVKGLLIAMGSADGPDSAAGADAALKGLAAGSITGAEIDAAREYCAGALRRTQEDPERLLDYCLRMAVTGAELSPDELAELCGRVTPGSVADIAAGAELDAVYFLGGGETED